MFVYKIDKLRGVDSNHLILCIDRKLPFKFSEITEIV